MKVPVRLRSCGIGIAGLLLALAATAAPAAEPALEQKVKAAFLYNFARYITWPAGKFADASSPLRICVLEPDPFGSLLDESLRGKLVESHPITVARSSQAANLRECHIVYAAGGDASRLEGAFAQLSGAGVVTVHESAHALSGGVMRFFQDDRKIRFEINTAAASREQLELSAKLQMLAITVRK